MNIFLYMKGNHSIRVIEQGNNAKVQGLAGWIDSLELQSILQGNGYKYIMTI